MFITRWTSLWPGSGAPYVSSPWQISTLIPLAIRCGWTACIHLYYENTRGARERPNFKRLLCSGKMDTRKFIFVNHFCGSMEWIASASLNMSKETALCPWWAMLSAAKLGPIPQDDWGALRLLLGAREHDIILLLISGQRKWCGY